MRCWPGRTTSSWLGLASISCQIVRCLTSRAGPSKTFSRIDDEPAGAPRSGSSDRDQGDGALGDRVIAISAHEALTGLGRLGEVPPLPQDITVGRRVIRAEIEGLEQLAQTLDGSFGLALDICAAVRGRLIVPGMGKSGHIARKIAATLASTGTPALFVHPAEASHGDLGMISFSDAILALLNSRASAELTDIVAYSRRFKIPLVAITGGTESILAEAADVVLLLPRAGEACSMGLAPTTSTTMMMALGDALAIVPLERKGFSAADFQRFPPGGKIGGRVVP